MAKGKMIVFEGLDGSGKQTQSELFYQKLIGMNKKVMKISYPRYDNASSSLVKMYLAGEFGTDPAAVNAYAASTFLRWTDMLRINKIMRNFTRMAVLSSRTDTPHPICCIKGQK